MGAEFDGGALTAVTTLLGAAFGAGLIAVVHGLWKRPDDPQSGADGTGLLQRLRQCVPQDWTRRRVAVAAVCGVVAGALTGWPVGALLTTAALLTLPGLLGPDRQAARRTEQMEALATWTEMLRDTLSSAAGLEQAVLATADIAPAPLETELRALATEVRAGRPLPSALRAFAEAVDDPLADVVVAALLTAAEQQARQLGALLGELAESVREQVAMRQRIDAGRASVRTGVRVTVMVTLGMTVGLVVFNRSYLQPFDTAAGQGVLAVIGALFAVAFGWLTSIGRIAEPGHLISTATTAEAGGTR
ncbi:type II secretion system F family protein [Streptomyces chilikensis]|uniref:type II secretion system F family protein n=1 Tax=Streptomyces chilikensis TaxID=1194079 RepID=UPI00140C0897|nr:type II secretion system F family protein [Streptomyces chilikensis]